MEFEFDENKSKANKIKNGIDFREAQSLWEDINRLVIPAKKMDEPRFLIIAWLNQKLWSAVFTIRSGKIRIISVRRSRKEERILYESK
jgi:uncharacterized protein